MNSLWGHIHLHYSSFRKPFSDLWIRGQIFSCYLPVSDCGFSVVLKIVPEHSSPSHRDSYASCLYISNQNTLISANFRPLTILHLCLLWGRRERDTLRDSERAENVRLAMHSNFLPSTPLQPSKERKRGRKRDGSHSCWPPCSCCFNMPRSHLPCHSLQDSTASFPPILPCVLNLLLSAEVVSHSLTPGLHNVFCSPEPRHVRFNFQCCFFIAILHVFYQTST